MNEEQQSQLEEGQPTASPSNTDNSKAGGERAVFSRVAALGLLLMAVAPAILLTASAITGALQEDPSEAGFFVVPLAATLLGSFLVWRFGAWAKVVGILVALGATMLLFWVAFGTSYPASFPDFVPAVAYPLGLLTTLVFGTAAIVQRFRGRFEAQATRAEKVIMRGLVGVVVLAALVSGSLNITQRGSVSAEEAAGADLEVVAYNFEFDQTAYRIGADRPTKVLVRNNDGFVHTFTIEELGIDETILPGGERLIALEAPSGDYTIICRPHTFADDGLDREDDMIAELRVR